MCRTRILFDILFLNSCLLQTLDIVAILVLVILILLHVAGYNILLYKYKL